VENSTHNNNDDNAHADSNSGQLTTPRVVVEPELPECEPGKKRIYTQDFRMRAVAYYDSLPEDGSRGAYLRRSGIRSSSMSEWRAAIRNGSVAKPGRKSIDPIMKENAVLKQRISKLESELERANTVIEVQKKVSQLLQNCSA
jgi:transposase